MRRTFVGDDGDGLHDVSNSDFGAADGERDGGGGGAVGGQLVELGAVEGVDDDLRHNVSECLSKGLCGCNEVVVPS